MERKKSLKSWFSKNCCKLSLIEASLHRSIDCLISLTSIPSCWSIEMLLLLGGAESFSKWAIPGLFLIIVGLFQTNITIFCINIMWKMSIQYSVLGFELTTLAPKAFSCTVWWMAPCRTIPMLVTLVPHYHSHFYYSCWDLCKVSKVYVNELANWVMSQAHYTMLHSGTFHSLKLGGA